MSVRRAVILIALILLSTGALLSVAAYTVQKQNDSNATDALTASTPTPPPVPLHSIEQSRSGLIPTTQNDAVDTDTASIQYKTVLSGTGNLQYAFEAPLDWNSLQKTVNNCVTEIIVSPQNATIDITPTACVAEPYAHTIEKNGYGISSNATDIAAYNHVVATFHITS